MLQHLSLQQERHRNKERSREPKFNRWCKMPQIMLWRVQDSKRVIQHRLMLILASKLRWPVAMQVDWIWFRNLPLIQMQLAIPSKWQDKLSLWSLNLQLRQQKRKRTHLQVVNQVAQQRRRRNDLSIFQIYCYKTVSRNTVERRVNRLAQESHIEWANVN